MLVNLEISLKTRNIPVINNPQCVLLLTEVISTSILFSIKFNSSLYFWIIVSETGNCWLIAAILSTFYWLIYFSIPLNLLRRRYFLRILTSSAGILLTHSIDHRAREPQRGNSSEDICMQVKGSQDNTFYSEDYGYYIIKYT